MSIAPVLMLATGLAVGGTAERFAGRLVSRVDLVVEGSTLPEAADHLVEIGAGDPFQPAAIRRSIKQLFALGAFSDIKVEAEAEGEGVALTFRLFPALRVGDVLIEGPDGEPIELARLREISLDEGGVQIGSLFDAVQVERLSDRFEEELTREGFYEAAVEPEVQFEGPNAMVRFHVQPGPRARLGVLRIHGALAHVERDMRQKLSMKPGDLYSRRALDEDIDRLVTRWKSNGFYEAEVEARETRQGVDSIQLDLLVNIGPRVLVGVEGAPFSDKAMNRLIPVLREQSISGDLIEESRANIERYFRERGHRNAVVTVERTPAGGGRYLVVKFQVEPSEKFRVGEVTIEGLTSLPSKQLLSVLSTRPRLFLDKPFRPQVWEEDLKQIRSYLRREGFHQAAVRGEVQDRADSVGVVDLTVHIEEGPRAFIEAIDIEGAQQVPSTKVLSSSGLEVGAPFEAPEILEAQERIVTLYRNRGFQEADVDVRSLLDETQTQASVGFLIREGEPSYVGQVILSGLEVTREEALRRNVTITPDAPLSSGELLETRQRLVGTGLFREVDIEVLEQEPDSRSSDVLIRFEEGPRTSFGYGFGYNERELLRAEAEITRRNLLGLNRTVSIFGRASIRGGRFITTYRQPEFFGYAMPAFISAFYEEEDRSSFDFNRRGVGLQLSKSISKHQNLFFRYNFNRTSVFRLEIPPEELPREFRNIRLSTVSVSQVTDTRDDPIAPNRGQFRLLDFEVSAKLLGSKSPYLKALAQQFFYLDLPRGLVGVIGLRLGVGQTFRQDRDALIPITERFFAGGANTLRGFGLDQASPKDPLGNPVGGNVLTLLNLELRFPILGKLGGVIFSDNGTVYRRLEVIQLLNWRYNVGFGFRYDTPLGPLRVDWGFKIDIRPGEPPSRFHVSLGHAF